MIDEASSGGRTGTASAVHWASKAFAGLLGLGVAMWVVIAVGLSLRPDPDPENDVRSVVAVLAYGSSGAAWGVACRSFWKGHPGRWLWFVAPIAIFVVCGMLSGEISNALGRQPLP